jgi:O-antigen ligase
VRSRLGVRPVLVVVFGLLALLGATGFTQAHVFHETSTLKYVLTIAGPLFLGTLAIVDDPLALVAAAVVVGAPYAGFSITPHGQRVPLMAPLVLLALVVWSVVQRPSRRLSRLLAAGVFMLVMLILPFLESPNQTGALVDLASLFGAALLAARVSRTRSGFVTICWAIVASASLQAALAIWEHITGHRLNLYGTAGSATYTSDPDYFFNFNGQARPPGAFYDPISLGNALALSLPVALVLALESVRRRRWWSVALAAGAVVLVGVGLEFTLSRMSWVGGAAGLLLVLILVPSRSRISLISLAATVLAVAALFGAFAAGSTGIERLSSILHPLSERGTGNGDLIRVEIWKIALSTARHHSIAGIGIDRFAHVLSGRLASAGTNGHAHSTYFQLAAEGGALAILGLLAVLVALVGDLRDMFRRDRYAAAMLAGSSLAVLICWLSDVTVRYSGVAILMGTVFGMVAGRVRSIESLARWDRRGIQLPLAPSGPPRLQAPAGAWTTSPEPVADARLLPEPAPSASTVSDARWLGGDGDRTV